jgi:hypothetical protein
MAGHEAETPSTGATDQALAAAGSGEAKGDAGPVKSDCVSNPEKPPKPAAPLTGACFEEMKRCVDKGPDTLECTSIVKKCSAGPAPAPDDAYLACIIKAKECYSYEKDPAVCDQLVAQCDKLGPESAEKPGKLPPPPSDDYTSCLIKGKECYGSSKDLTVCDDLLKACEALKPEPADGAQAADAAYAACQLKTKECYAAEPDTSICDAQRERCDSLLSPEPK